jgi:16S rRNA processing protein RimM
LKGEVVVSLVTTVSERLSPGSLLDCEGRPLVVDHSRPLPVKGGVHLSHWVVQFTTVHDRDQAQALTGSLLRAEAQEGAEGLWVHELVGSAVRTADGEERGRVVAVEANPASDLLVLDTGALVPLRFVVSQGSGTVTVDPPPGLFGD